MKALLKSALILTAAAITTHAAAHVTFWEHEGFSGGSISADHALENFQVQGFNDRTSAVVIERQAWEVCEHAFFQGRCAVLRPGRYPSLHAMGLNDQLSSARPMGERPGRDDHHGPDHDHGRPHPPHDDRNGRGHDEHGEPGITFFEHDRFDGRSFTARDDVRNFVRLGTNDRASSVIVRGAPWEVCEHVNYEGRCAVLRPGHYADLHAMGLNDQLSSARRAHVRRDRDDRPPQPVMDWRRRPEERVYDAQVTAVRAVYARQEQRCWMEREQLPAAQRNMNVKGAAIGGIVGGIIGHQVGRGGNRDVITVVGAAAGMAIGSQVGRDREETREVRRCEQAPQAGAPAFWDVTYQFRGAEHHMQTTSPPGRTVKVNARGEPRV